MPVSGHVAGPAGTSVARFEDLIGDSSQDFSAYFDPREFETRAWLEDEHYWHLHRRELLRRVLERHCPDRRARLIEIGCGAGTVATHLNQNGRDVDYADVHPEALHFARERAESRLGAIAKKRRFVRLDVTRLPPLHGYQGVLLFDVLEHLPDDFAVMRAIRAQLVAGAARHGDPDPDPNPDAHDQRPFVLFTVPAFEMLWSPWDDLEKHKRRYTVGSASALAVESGFEVVRSTYFFSPLFFAAAAVKGLRLARRTLFHEPPAPTHLGELTEAKSYSTLNRAMLRLLAFETRWLERRDLPLGTSILVWARPAR
jgi:SAM-dependent methyltransferase